MGDKSNLNASIIVPAFQESRNIGRVISSVLDVCAKSDFKSELIVICDGSTDGTGEIAEAAGARVIRHAYNRGYGASLKTGIKAAKGSTVIFMDADGQHNASDILRLVERRNSYDMVVGERAGTSGSPLWRKPGKIFLGWLANRLTGRKIPDLNSGFRALDREMALRILPLMPDGFSFSTTSTIAGFKGGYNIGYIAIEINKRANGKSTVSLLDGLNTIMLIIRIVTLFSPLRIYLSFSLVAFLIGLGFTLNSYIIFGESSIKGLIALLASVQFFLFGILVDQISAIRRGEIIK